jgi:flagellar FliL protein
VSVDADLLEQAFLDESGGARRAGGRRRVVALVLAAVVVAAGAGWLAYWQVTKPPGKVHLANGPVDDLGTMTFQLADGSYLQVGLALQLTNVADVHEVAADRARIDNALVFVFGSMTATEIQSNAGKAAAQAAIVRAVDSILGPRDGLPQVTRAYYTSPPLTQPLT